MQPNTPIRREYKGKIYVKFMLKISEKVMQDTKKIIPDSQHTTLLTKVANITRQIRAFPSHCM